MSNSLHELDSDQRRQLDEQGFLLLPNLMSALLLDELRLRVAALFEAEGNAAGSEFKQEPGSLRLANLVNKGQVFARLIDQPQVLACARHVLGEDLKLSSLNARTAVPGAGWTQPLHADMGAVADERGYWVFNSVWMLDDFTEENGTLRAVPGSHRWGRLPAEELADLTAPHPDEQILTGAAGSVLVMNAHLWHGGTANQTTAPRRAVHVFYCRGDRPQQQYQKQLLSAEVQSRLTPAQRKLLALDDERNDRLSAAPEKTSGFLK